MNVASYDGVEVPLNIFYKEGVKLNRQNRVLIDVYGAYGISQENQFSLVNLVAMERGWVLAQAGVRGGGEKGTKWHEEGKKLQKINSVRDLIACT